MITLMAVAFGYAAQAADFSYEDLQRLIQSGGLTTVEQVLPRLPAELLSNYTLMENSRSLQYGSPENPRAILFGKNARLTCAFGGDPSRYGYDSLECVQFREAERTFDFRQIQFPSPQNGLKAVQFSLSNRTADGAVSCKACHGADPRPNWDHYNSWPGAYGADDDRLNLDTEKYRAYANSRHTHPRYQWLRQEDYSAAPFRSDYGEPVISHRPNFRLSDLFGRLNALRAARLLTERVPAWKRWAYVVSALHCELTPEQSTRLTKAGFDLPGGLRIEKIFGDLGLKFYEWSTQISADNQNYPNRPWEHQSGFSLFSESVAMALIQDKARAGDAVFAQAIEAISAYFAKTYYDEEKEFNRILNEIVPSPDYFGVGYKENLALLCPEATNVLANEATRTPLYR